MEIGRHINSVDPNMAKRQVGKADGRQPTSDKTDEGTKTVRSSGADLSSGELQKYVNILKDMDPVDLHRIEDLQRRIADGSYDSDLSDNLDDLMTFLDDDGAA